jgi:hypothetical protein
MLKKDEEDIFPFLKEYILQILIDSFPEMESYKVNTHLNNFYNLENNSIEQRYLYILAAFGFNTFHSGFGLSESEEIDIQVIHKLLLKIFLTNYTQFNTETITGLFLLYRYGEGFKKDLEPASLLLFEVMLKRIVKLLLYFNGNEDNEEENNVLNEIDKINLV